MKEDFTYNKEELRIHELHAKPGGIAKLSESDYSEFKTLVASNAKTRGLIK